MRVLILEGGEGAQRRRLRSKGQAGSRGASAHHRPRPAGGVSRPVRRHVSHGAVAPANAERRVAAGNPPRHGEGDHSRPWPQDGGGASVAPDLMQRGVVPIVCAMENTRLTRRSEPPVSDWRDENCGAITAANEWIEAHGVPLADCRLF